MTAASSTEPVSERFFGYFNLVDVELLHHFTLYTAAGMSEEAGSKLWNEDFVKLGFDHPYILHGMLATAALHIFALDHSRIELMDVASAHYTVSLRLAEPVMADVTQSDSIPLSVYSTTASIYTIGHVALSRFHPKYRSDDILGSMLSCMRLARESTTMIEPHLEFLRTSWAKDAISQEDQLAESSIPLDKHRPQMRLLQDIVIRVVGSEEQQQACIKNIDYCFKCLTDLEQKAGGLRSRELARRALLVTDPYFLEMLEQRMPVALCILAHLAAIAHLSSDAWWLAGLPQSLFIHIEASLNETWTEVLAFPRSIIQHGI